MKGLTRGLSVLVGLLLVFGRVPATKNRAELPMKLYHGYTIVAQGSIGSLKKLNFLIDTGAVPSVVAQRIARKLALRGTVDKVTVFSQTLQTQRVVLPSANWVQSGRNPFLSWSRTCRTSKTGLASGLTPRSGSTCWV